jgi:dihydroneopterin triphosphate diphosphatase
VTITPSNPRPINPVLVITANVAVVCISSVGQHTIPVVYVTGEFTWGPDVLVIPEYAFGVRVEKSELTLSQEHTEYGWFALKDAAKAVQWDSNRTALWELDHRLRHGTVHRAA